MADQPLNQWALGTFEMNGVMVPVALMLASFREAKEQFEIDIDEMEEELAKFRENNPHLEKVARTKEARIGRLCKVVDTYEMMLAYHQDQIKQLQRLNAEIRQPHRDGFINQNNGGYHSIKTMLRDRFGG